MELVVIKKDNIFTDSKVIADGVGYDHLTITKILRRYRTDFEAFGSLRFMDKVSKNPNGGRPQKIYLLNEEQASLLITFLENNKVVRAFKVELVRQFYEMKKFILERQTEIWQDTRKQGKLTRRSETDVIKELVEYAKSQGSEHSDKLYITYSNLVKKMSGVKERELATTTQLNNLTLMEFMVLQTIKLGMSLCKDYHEIYKDCKARLNSFKDITFLEQM